MIYAEFQPPVLNVSIVGQEAMDLWKDILDFLQEESSRSRL